VIKGIVIEFFSHIFHRFDIKNNLANQDGDATSVILKVSHDDAVNRSPSLKWRIFHGTHSMLGGLFLTSGSSMYFAELIRRYPIALTFGGWLLTIGSFFLLLADLQEWWYNRRISNTSLRQHLHSSISNRLKRVEIRTNFFVAACGSALYVVGSFLLVPTFEKYVILGDWLIIAGSTIIFLSASWKICRAGHINVIDPYDHRFLLENITNDMSALIIDVFIGLGGIFYFLGVLLSLPKFSVDDFSINISAGLCVFGGISFFLASIFLQFQYYCKE
jgi:hypothetical protein